MRAEGNGCPGNTGQGADPLIRRGDIEDGCIGNGKSAELTQRVGGASGEYTGVDIGCTAINARPAQRQGSWANLSQTSGSGDKSGVARRRIVSAGRQNMRAEVDSRPAGAGQRANCLIGQRDIEAG